LTCDDAVAHFVDRGLRVPARPVRVESDRSHVAARLLNMTLHRGGEEEVGVRALHDRLSEHLDRVEQGVEIVVTRRGKRVARLSAIGRDDALAELVRRGVVRLPERPRSRRHVGVPARGSVSELVSEQRR